jgi:putative hydrolase of the HAD superfamily
VAADAQFRAVLFDFGGTLFSYRPLRERFDRFLVEMAARFDVRAPADELRRAYATAVLPVARDYLSRPFYLHSEMFGDMGEAYLRALGVTPSEDSRRLFYAGQTDVALAEMEPRPGTVDTLRMLRKRGLHVGVVSNIDDDQFDALWARCGLGPWVDAITTSEQARSCKPDPEIFRTALEKAGGVQPEEVVFVGDSVPHDVAGANSLGMTSVLIEDLASDAGLPHQPTHVIADLRELIEIAQVGAPGAAG